MRRLSLALTLALAVALLPATPRATSALAASAGLRLDYDHLVLTPSGDRLLVKEAAGLVNAGSGAVNTVSMPLPPGYSDLKLESGFDAANVTSDAAGVVDSSGLAAGGQREVVLSYSLPMTGGQAKLEKSVTYDTAAFSVAAEDRLLGLTGDAPLTVSVSDLNGVSYANLRADAVAAGQNLTIRATVKSDGAPSAPPSTLTPNAGRLLNRSSHGGPDNVMLWQRFTGQPGHWGLPGIVIILAIVVVGLGAVGRAAVSLARNGRGQVKVSGPAGVPDRPRRSALVREIAELDRLFAAGRLPESEYRSKRSTLKRELMALMAGSGGNQA
ncbi:MAG TPA: hypothetical protein VGL40_03075 [Bacillota bacterium]